MSAATVRTVGRAGAPARSAAPSRAGAPRTAGSSRATTRPTSSRTATSRPAEGPRRTTALRLVPQAPGAARAPFVGVVVGLLALGLLGLLALNTSLAESSFRLHALQGQAKVLADQEQVLRQEVEALQAPAALARRAEALGMVPGGPPAFLRLSDGKVLGKPSPAVPAVPAVPVAPVVGAPGSAPTPAPERLLSRAPAASEATGSTEDSATQDSASEDSATEDSASEDSASDASSETASAGERVDDGAVDDGATDADDSAGTDAATSTSSGARR